MKMKEVNLWLAIGGFCQLAVIGCTGAFVNELLKDNKNVILIVASIILTVILGCIGIGIYANVHNKILKRNE